MPLFLYVVARDRRDLYEQLKAEFAGRDGVAVVLDRRRGERRRSSRTLGSDLRRAGRRKQPELDHELRTVGSFVTEHNGVDLVLVDY